jgi:hypothetical protein
MGVFSFHDSPVDAGSGSIYAKVRWFRCFHEHTAGKIYRAKPDDNDLITTTGLQDPPPALSGTGGWTIIFAGRDASMNSKDDVARLCSNVNGDNNGVDKDGWVYLKITGEAQWKTKSLSRKLYYHDTSKGCECLAGQQDGPCDYLTSVTITTHQGFNKKFRSIDGKCSVTIGGAAARKLKNKR